MHPEVQ